MRRPVCVKNVFLFLGSGSSALSQAASVAILKRERPTGTSENRSQKSADCRCCNLIIDLCFHRSEEGPGVGQSPELDGSARQREFPLRYGIYGSRWWLRNGS
jgi:hypothetical protein